MSIRKGAVKELSLIAQNFDAATVFYIIIGYHEIICIIH